MFGQFNGGESRLGANNNGAQFKITTCLLLVSSLPKGSFCGPYAGGLLRSRVLVYIERNVVDLAI